MIMHHFNFLGSHQLHDLTSHPFTARISILPRHIHECPIILTKRRIQIQNHFGLWNLVAPLCPLSKSKKSRSNTMTESTRTEVNTNPQMSILVHEHIDIVISRANRAKLITSLILQLPHFSMTSTLLQTIPTIPIK